MLKVAASFYGKLETIAIQDVNLPPFPPNKSSINCIYRFFLQHFECVNKAIYINQRKAYVYHT